MSPSDINNETVWGLKAARWGLAILKIGLCTNTVGNRGIKRFFFFFEPSAAYSLYFHYWILIDAGSK